MTIAIVAAFCVVLLILAFLRAAPLAQAPSAAGPRSPEPRPRSPTRRPASSALVSKPFRSSQKAIHKSGSAGRKGRDKMPF
jgi:hypothetical protein